MKPLTLLCCFLTGLNFCNPGTAAAEHPMSEFGALYENLPFEMPLLERPAIPDYSVTLTDFGGVGENHRPDLVLLWDCENVLLEDCTFQNSGNWNVHPMLCRNLIIRNVIIAGSSFDCGDDAICIKSGKDQPGRDRGVSMRFCDDITFSDTRILPSEGDEFTI